MRTFEGNPSRVVTSIKLGTKLGTAAIVCSLQAAVTLSEPRVNTTIYDNFCLFAWGWVYTLVVD